ncbi:plant virulence effector HPE1-like domain-containing protein [Sinorhizobium sp. 7-81]|uniref:plant virulence effector HPE1-like domain-containing protein n=1 Tax=Sinorhizobium sp. 8-89 TaxID=3049089 RepID=UPI0024C3C7B3|nr:plant virulence effector HPE1-like domain-containing protein [Sinorhizobium sp. 8-89]MDK1488749.1 plant virulence effector HPE1-like domain-containing protein [Sinorhizobium sp. 8-89]
MRSLLISGAFALLAGTAAASSIEDVVSGKAVNSSVAAVSCADCPPLQPKKKSSYVVPEITPGTDKIELKEIGGEVKLVRTEAWLGGSPVVFVSKAPEEVVRAAATKTGGSATASASMGIDLRQPATGGTISPQIDETAKTAAVHAISHAEPVAASMAKDNSQEFDPAAFELRLD